LGESKLEIEKEEKKNQNKNEIIKNEKHWRRRW